MKKMLQDQRQETVVTAVVSSGSRLCASRTDCLSALDGGRAARKVSHCGQARRNATIEATVVEFGTSLVCEQATRQNGTIAAFRVL
jgi:hypothetical protein